MSTEARLMLELRGGMPTVVNRDCGDEASPNVYGDTAGTGSWSNMSTPGNDRAVFPEYIGVHQHFSGSFFVGTKDEFDYVCGLLKKHSAPIDEADDGLEVME